jgi:hypothetical protein
LIFKQEVIQNFVNLEYETKQDIANLEEEVKKSIGEQVVKNTNKITAVENVLISKGTIAKQEGTLTEERQQTGGADLEGLEVLDGSYATVTDIKGKTIASKNLFDMNKLLQADNWTESNGEYSGHISYLYSIYKDSEGGLLGKLNIQDQVSISLLAKQANGTVNTLMIGVLYTDATRDYFSINSLDWKKYTFTTAPNKTIELIYITYSSGEIVYIKEFCIKIGANDYEYVPYFQGLKNAQISGIKSIGRNLLNLDRTEQKTSSYAEGLNDVKRTNLDENKFLYGFAASNYWFPERITNVSVGDNKVLFKSVESGYGVGFPIKISPNRTYTVSYKNGKNSVVYASFFEKDGTFISPYQLYGQNRTFDMSVITPQMQQVQGKTPYWMVICVSSNEANIDVEVNDVMVSQTETALPYEPYTESVMTLPETVKLGEWDHIENGKVVKQTDVVEITNSTDWVLDADGYYYLVDYRLKAGSSATKTISTDNGGTYWINS